MGNSHSSLGCKHPCDMINWALDIFASNAPLEKQLCILISVCNVFLLLSPFLFGSSVSRRGASSQNEVHKGDEQRAAVPGEEKIH